jgi:hypothetical protein
LAACRNCSAPLHYRQLDSSHPLYQASAAQADSLSARRCRFVLDEAPMVVCGVPARPERLCPMTLHALKDRYTVYKQLMRMDKPIGTLLLLWPTLWGLWIAGNGKPDPLVVLIFVLGTFLMRSAGCVINDYADRHYDMHVERTSQRPFARGAVTEREALLLALVLAILSFLLILPLNQLTWLMSVPAVFVAASYPFTKRFFPMPQAYLGIAFLAFRWPLPRSTITFRAGLAAAGGQCLLDRGLRHRLCHGRQAG